ncbi:MAG TPA: insulinase family protein [Phycisphaerales bacterium]|nr:insulinase family protein [Phycisphaerales bacterium]
MMTTTPDTHILDNGMVILGEPMPHVASAAFNFMIPAGAAMLPDGCCGAANVICDWIFRGAGERDSRQLSDAMDRLGLHRMDSVSSSHLSVGAAMEAGNLAAAIDLYADTILAPHLTDEQFAPARELAIDAVHSLDDDPRQKVALHLRDQFYPHPLGRNTEGNVAELEQLTAEQTRRLIARRFDISQMLFAVTGRYDFPAICRQLEDRFGSRRGIDAPEPQLKGPGRHYTHIPNDGAQVHIGLMTACVKPADEDYYDARVAVSVLSGGMSARLFTEVREKRGLCYAIGARYHGLRNAAGVLCYAGTTPDKARETFDVTAEQFRGLSEGITQDEINRAKAGLKSAVIMHSESSSNRVGGIGMDHYLLGRVRSLDEIKRRIDATTLGSVRDFLRRHPFTDFTVVTIGPRPIDVEQQRHE